MAFFACTLKGNLFIFIPFAITILFLSFRFMTTVVDEYIAEAITYIVKITKMSDAVAGVTLIAFANGAGDLVTAIVSSEAADGVSYNIGSLFGAGLFVVTLVISMTILFSSKPIIVSNDVIYRDIMFYILGVMFIIGFGIYGEINAFTSTLCLLLYFVYVVLVIV